MHFWQDYKHTQFTAIIVGSAFDLLDIELVDSEEPNDPKETQQPSQQVEIPVDETDVRRSKRSKK